MRMRSRFKFAWTARGEKEERQDWKALDHAAAGKREAINLLRGEQGIQPP